MTTMIMTIVVVISVLASFFSIEAIYAQTTTPSTTEPTDNYYVDVLNGFRVQLPDGWVAEDTSFSSSDPERSEQDEREILELMGSSEEPVANLCPETIAIPKIGGGSDCPVIAEPIIIGVNKYHFDLSIMQPFAEIIDSGRNVTTDDLLAFQIQEEQRRLSFDIEIVNETDTTTNLVDPETNEVVSSVPVKIVEYTYSSQFTRANGLPNEIKLMLFAVHNDPETGQAAGYLVPVGIESADVIQTPPGTIARMPEVRQVFDSFELLTTATTSGN